MQKVKLNTQDIEGSERIETGVVELTYRNKIGHDSKADWPGLFIRGDDCLHYSMNLEHILSLIPEETKDKNIFFIKTTENLLDIIKSTRIT